MKKLKVMLIAAGIMTSLSFVNSYATAGYNNNNTGYNNNNNNTLTDDSADMIFDYIEDKNDKDKSII